MILRKIRKRDEIIAVSMYSISLTLLYLCSTLYHAASTFFPSFIYFTEYLDSCAIYVLIAGTYTPFTVVISREATQLKGRIWFIISWLWVIVGIAVKIILGNVNLILSNTLYLGMAYSLIFGGPSLHKMIPKRSFWYLALGGLSYTFGVIFYSWKTLPFHHSIWHIYVLAGSAFHYVAIITGVLLRPQKAHEFIDRTYKSLQL